MPQVHEALQRMERELALARQEKTKLLKLIHGYGSSGPGGDIRIAVQKRLVEMSQSAQILAKNQRAGTTAFTGSNRAEKCRRNGAS